ncbi:glutamate 5-kinase [Dokdonella sp.]|uniref:glutamate 5-kinase n=1 Tax=Dokdonella sp. TaxID=2291710 RepID=UPI0025B88AFC|nr:glutamate 5-kinase [Dokdonella sp.]MBX3688293.1 glutamate 5-kinase [Dokdonella sp.]
MAWGKSMGSGFTQQALPTWRRAVLKVGSSLLADRDGNLSDRTARGLAAFITAARAVGHEVVLVSSGAVAAGRAQVPTTPRKGGGLVLRQALAALGQTRMIGLWQGLLAMPVAQVLLSHDDLRDRRRYLNARNTLLELLRLHAVPIINENDTVAVEELKLGDNDNLAAIVAALVDADLLLIASDVDGLYDAHPLHDPAARPIERVDAITPAVLAVAGGSGSAVGTGGMRTKLEAASKAGKAGIATALFNGADADTVALLARGCLRGTHFAAAGSRLAARKYWLRHAPGTQGWVRVDAGAAAALRCGASLLPGGVVGIDGEFARGDLVDIVDGAGSAFARGLCQYAAGSARRIAGRHTREIEALLGYSYGEEMIRRDDLVLFDEAVA